jgi:hypothetical protein
MFELRTYSLADRSTAETYATVHWARHLVTLPRFGITTHGVWLPADGSPRVLALVSYAPGEDPRAVGARYMASGDFRDDMAGFDMAGIVGVSSELLEPSAAVLSAVPGGS